MDVQACVALALVASGRVGGSALRSAERERMLRQRDPLRVVTLAWLERLVADEVEDDGDRLTAGSVLWLPFCRSRMADSQHLIGEPWCSGKYIEGESNRTKTSKFAGSRLKKQILVCPAMCVTGVDWFPAWSDLRAAKGMKVSGDQVPMPVQLAEGRWPAAAQDGYELTLTLRHPLQKAGAEPTDISNIGSHSCKCTCLSLLAKAGVQAEKR
jgi:hypothetical protein